MKAQWSSKCSDCHNEHGAEGLNLQVGKSHASLMAPGVGPCAAGPRVTPGSPDASLLVLRISADGCGRRMPMGDPDYFDLNPGELTQSRSWILAGALDNQFLESDSSFENRFSPYSTECILGGLPPGVSCFTA